MMMTLPQGGAWKDVPHYKSTLGIGVVGLNHQVVTQHNPDEVMMECVEALNRLSSEWSRTPSRLHLLHKPSYAFRLADVAGARPQLSDLVDDMERSSSMWHALLSRVMDGVWVDQEWKVNIPSPWSMQHLCYKFRLMMNGNIPPSGEELCLPIRADLIPAASGPFHTRHYLSPHVHDGYIRVNLGTTTAGAALALPLHVIIAEAFHGPPMIVLQTGKLQEVCHSCGNPWCINPRHIYWCSHAENCAD